MNMVKTSAVVIGAIILGLAHSIAQFVLWANQGRIDGAVGGGSSLFWSVLSFPLFSVLPRAFTTRFFWLVFGANSLIWAVVFLLIGVALLGKTNLGRSAG